ncbi:MAG: 1-acyl-sn-glycerol-3-phosphate acyltransferase [Bacillota bacterium]|jgi:1-acyl-sn-glycerol-3-phosphate acyltransferase|nr:1-acyl-sn-glycerol-3-phosphate acyltransferase [Bacillota bacterium]
MFFKLTRGFQVTGQEHFPEQGPVVLVANHASYLDPPALGVASPRRVYFMAKDELFQIPLFGRLLKGLGAFPVKRGTPDRRAFKRALEVLASGNVLGIFPEGTRSKTGELGPAEEGAAVLALRSGAPVVPAGICGMQGSGPIKVIFGPPVDTSDLNPKDRASIRILSQRVMTSIAGLLSEADKRNA